MDDYAEDLYSELARACPEPDLAQTFAQLARDEAEHTGWWQGLLEAWEQGLLPDAVNDTTSLTERLTVLHEELSSITSDRLGELSVDEMLALAARIEFFMIDPVFGELIDLTEPARAERRHSAYQAHLQRLIDAIGEHYAPGTLAGLLAQTLSRTWRDNLRLAIFATHDVLTGLYNRRALYTHLPQWAAWSARYGHPLTVLLIDVDNFKDVNDRYGHGVGDRALKAIAQALRHAVRASDLIVRYGGDEFAVIAPETDADEYRNVCERILTTIRALDVRDETGERVPLSVSIGGVIASDPAGSSARRIDSLLVGADQSLYAAKRSGRDRFAPPVETGPGIS
jgi:diguanylate cyclase (GGDEF)-like protein